MLYVCLFACVLLQTLHKVSFARRGFPNKLNDTLQSCMSCGWMQASENIVNSPPSTATIYLHMRKAGGLTFLELFQKWMIGRNCTERKQFHLHFMEVGISDGWIKGASKTICPAISLRHHEYDCFDSNLLRKIPSIENRTMPLSIFTIFRHPIDRIISQAFYGLQSVGTIVVEETIVLQCFDGNRDKVKAFHRGRFGVRKLITRCKRENNLKDPVCLCTLRAMDVARANMRTNETIWFDWFNRRYGFGDHYMDNYYIKRITSAVVSNPNTLSKFETALSCLEYKTTQYCEGIVNILSDLFPPKLRCQARNMKFHSNHKLLQLAKEVLREKITFVLLEKLSDYSSAMVMAAVLGEQNITWVHSMLSASALNAGIFSQQLPQGTSTGLHIQHPRVLESVNLGNVHQVEKLKALQMSKDKNGIVQAEVDSAADRYRILPHHTRVMPVSVVQYLMRENAMDIELYNYALQLFESRTQHGR